MQRLHRIPSNRIHDYVPRGNMGPGCVGLFAIYVFTIGYFIWKNGVPAMTAAACILLVILAGGWWRARRDTQRQDRLSAERTTESICTFARSFNCREIDTWIIRAVHEELEVGFPIRSTDNIVDDLNIDPEELESIAEVIAQRISRPLDRSELNPMCGKVTTVRDLVAFFALQPPRGSTPIH